MEDCNFQFQAKSNHFVWWTKLDPGIYWYFKKTTWNWMMLLETKKILAQISLLQKARNIFN